VTAVDEFRQYPGLPQNAGLSLNRCNLPAAVLGGVAYQKCPQPLSLDGVMELHRAFFRSLKPFDKVATRASCFRDYMSSCFLLDNLDQAGLNKDGNFVRPKADYLRTLRGWMFDADGQEAAVLKGWVESRFGLLAQHHLGKLGDYDSSSYRAFQSARARGLYNTNALESQLDLLYAWCQYELHQRYPDIKHFQLFRGANRWSQHDVLSHGGKEQYVILLNNLNSFSEDKECADAFGDCLLECSVPLTKILYFPGLLPGVLPGEKEFLVIGGLYEVTRLPW